MYSTSTDAVNTEYATSIYRNLTEAAASRLAIESGSATFKPIPPAVALIQVTPGTEIKIQTVQTSGANRSLSTTISSYLTIQELPSSITR
jgi:hypothetical protein